MRHYLFQSLWLWNNCGCNNTNSKIPFEVINAVLATNEREKNNRFIDGVDNKFYWYAGFDYCFFLKCQICDNISNQGIRTNTDFYAIFKNFVECVNLSQWKNDWNLCWEKKWRKYLPIDESFIDHWLNCIHDGYGCFYGHSLNIHTELFFIHKIFYISCVKRSQFNCNSKFFLKITETVVFLSVVNPNRQIQANTSFVMKGTHCKM